MYIHVEPVNDKNREAVLALKIHETQKGFVESPEQCLKEAAEEKCWRPVGIYDGEQLVGFSMYGYFWQYLAGPAADRPGLSGPWLWPHRTPDDDREAEKRIPQKEDLLKRSRRKSGCNPPL